MWFLVLNAFADAICIPVVAIFPRDQALGVWGEFRPYVELDPCSPPVLVTLLGPTGAEVLREEEFTGGELPFVTLESGVHTLEVRDPLQLLDSVSFTVDTTLAPVPPPGPPAFTVELNEFDGIEARLRFDPVPGTDLASFLHLGEETVERVRSGVYSFNYPGDDHCFDVRVRAIDGNWSQPTTECGILDAPPPEKSCSSSGQSAWSTGLPGLFFRR